MRSSPIFVLVAFWLVSLATAISAMAENQAQDPTIKAIAGADKALTPILLNQANAAFQQSFSTSSQADGTPSGLANYPAGVTSLRANGRTDTLNNENSASPFSIPRPFLFAGPSLASGGYRPISASYIAGFTLDSRRLVGDFEAGYGGAPKIDDNTSGNDTGHERALKGRLFYPWRRSLYLGGGAQWSKTSTTNYVKSAWRPTFGVGGDHFSNDWSCRWQALYITKGSDKSNALQGPELQFWLPSPASRQHLFFRETLGLYEFHATITDPADRRLTASQISHRGVASFLDFAFGWRF